MIRGLTEAAGTLANMAVAAAVAVALFMLTACAHDQAAPHPASPAPIATSGPAVIADRTVIDEKAMIGLELTHKALRLGLKKLTDAGKIKGGQALLAAQLNQRAFYAIEALHDAYAAGNARSYWEAVDRAKEAIATARDVVEGRK